MSEKQRFQEIQGEIRNDIAHIMNLFEILYKKLEELPLHEAKNWMYDVFLDKIYETNAKLMQFLDDIGASRLKTDLQDKVNLIKNRSSIIRSPGAYGFEDMWDYLERAIDSYVKQIEWTMSSILQLMYETNWEGLEKIKTEDYVVIKKRARFVMARDELEHAKQAIKNRKWDDILNHLRPAIDMAIKEKFGFQKIHPKKQFLKDADKYDLPLPSYTMIYDYFDEGSHRIHGGRINPPWECQKALSFVAEFIDRLELIDVSQKKIEEFKKTCRAAS